MTIRRNYFRQQADVVMRLALTTSDTVQARLLLMKAYNLLVAADQAASSRNVPADRGSRPVLNPAKPGLDGLLTRQTA